MKNTNSRITELLQQHQHEAAKRYLNEKSADDAATSFNLNVTERTAYLNSIQPPIVRRGAITIAQALMSAA